MASRAAAINPSLYEKLSYDTQKDLAPVALVVNNVELLVANPANPAKDADGVFRHRQHPALRDRAALGFERGQPDACALQGRCTCDHRPDGRAGGRLLRRHPMWFARFPTERCADWVRSQGGTVWVAEDGSEACAYLQQSPAALGLRGLSIVRLEQTLTLDGDALGQECPWHYIVATDVLPEQEADFNTWYDTEHLAGLAAGLINKIARAKPMRWLPVPNDCTSPSTWVTLPIRV